MAMRVNVLRIAWYCFGVAMKRRDFIKVTRGFDSDLDARDAHLLLPISHNGARGILILSSIANGVAAGELAHR